MSKDTSRNRLLKQSEVAEVLGVSPRSVEGWRLSGRGPRFVRLSSRAIRYRPEDVDAWIAERVRRSTSDRPTAAP